MAIPDLAQFRELLRRNSADDVTSNIVLGDESAHVSADDLAFLAERFRAVFQLSAAEFTIVVVGSAKLGFSLVEKERKGSYKPRYRTFDHESDIDLAVVSQKLYFRCWRQLCAYSHAQPFLPWDAGKLADYMILGWIRPDKSPRERASSLLDDWWRLFGELSNLSRFGRRRIRGGLYFMKSFLHDYQLRAVAECAQVEMQQ